MDFCTAGDCCCRNTLCSWVRRVRPFVKSSTAILARSRRESMLVLLLVLLVLLMLLLDDDGGFCRGDPMEGDVSTTNTTIIVLCSALVLAPRLYCTVLYCRLDEATAYLRRQSYSTDRQR